MSVGADLHHLLTDEANEEELSKHNEATGNKPSQYDTNDQFYVCVYGLNPKDIPRSTGYSNKRPRKHYVADRSGTVCPECNYAMYTPATCVASPANAKKKRPAVPEGGYVKDVVTYMIMDDLEVKPMSTNSSIAVLNKFMSRMLVPLKRK